MAANSASDGIRSGGKRCFETRAAVSCANCDSRESVFGEVSETFVLCILESCLMVKAVFAK